MTSNYAATYQKDLQRFQSLYFFRFLHFTMACPWTTRRLTVELCMLTGAKRGKLPRHARAAKFPAILSLSSQGYSSGQWNLHRGNRPLFTVTFVATPYLHARTETRGMERRGPPSRFSRTNYSLPMVTPHVMDPCVPRGLREQNVSRHPSCPDAARCGNERRAKRPTQMYDPKKVTRPGLVTDTIFFGFRYLYGQSSQVYIRRRCGGTHKKEEGMSVLWVAVWGVKGLGQTPDPCLPLRAEAGLVVLFQYQTHGYYWPRKVYWSL